MAKQSDRVGLWLVGACGGVGTTVLLGLESIRRGIEQPTGLIGHLPPFDKLQLAPLDAWVVGGHEIRETTPLQAAREFHRQAGVFRAETLKACATALKNTSREIRDGVIAHCGRPVGDMADRPAIHRNESAAAAVERLTDDIESFGRRHALRHVVVVNIASTEPPFVLSQTHQDWPRLSKALARRGPSPLPASSLYALAAIDAGASYINFTPSLGIDVPALRQRAAKAGTAFMGNDGKTGETLMKSVLAPMFAARNLRVLSWVGHNIFGNRDAVALDDPANKAAKIRSKDHLIHSILGYRPQSLVSIEYIPSLDDWKTAWDHIHFEGFLGTRMVLQFIWQGCDSLLAAPLVIELARFAERAAREKFAGPLTHLACFFKSPIDVTEQSFAAQYDLLVAYATRPR